jgi:glycosyltransferase involved in cell wall biosynthesis
MKYVVTGTIDERTSFPTNRFKGFCYESWGYAWSMIDGITAEYIPYKEILNTPGLIDEIDIIHCAWDLDEIIDAAHEKCYVIITEHGSGLNMDKINNISGKIEFKEKIDKVDLLLATTYAGYEYWKLFTDTDVLNVPLPIDLNFYKPRGMDKFDDFTVSIGEVIPNCGNDRPLQYLAISIINSIGAKIAATINPDNPVTIDDIIDVCGIGEESIEIYQHGDFKSMAMSYLPKSHASMMISTLPTFGRLAYISAAIGVPCVASYYQMQRDICPQLSFSYNEINKMKDALIRLRDDEEFYNQCVDDSLNNMKQMSEYNIAKRICNEILPLITGARHKNHYFKWQNASDYDKKIIEYTEL